LELIGAASEWWNSYINGHEQPESIVWKEFRELYFTSYSRECDEAQEEGVPYLKAGTDDGN
jgi:hypothetical protein